MKACIIPQSRRWSACGLLLLAAACGAPPPDQQPAAAPPPGAPGTPEQEPVPPAPGPESLTATLPPPPQAATRPELDAWRRAWSESPPAGWEPSRAPELAARREAAPAGSGGWIDLSLALADEELRRGRFGEALAATQAAVDAQRRAWAAEIASGVVRADTPSQADWLPRPLQQAGVAALWLALELEALAPGRPAAMMWPPGPDGVHRDPLRAATAAGACRERLALGPDDAAAWRLQVATALAGGQPQPVAGGGAPEAAADMEGARILHTDLRPHRPAGALAAADVDADGHLDLLVSDAGPLPGLLILRGDGQGGFLPAETAGGPEAQPGATGIHPADVDGDGVMEVLLVRAPLAGGGAGPLSLLSGRDGRLSDITVGSGLDRAPLPIRDAAWLDVDRDGDLDLMLARDDGDLLLLQEPPGRWRPAPAAALSGPAGSSLYLARADVDGDGDIDLHAVGADGDLLYRNDGAGGLQAEPGPPGPRPAPGPACFVDADGDGDPDLLAAPGPGAAPAVAAADHGRPPRNRAAIPVLLRNEGGVLAPWPEHAPDLPPLAASALACGDPDDDGRPDVWAAADDGGRDLFLPHRLFRTDPDTAGLEPAGTGPLVPGQAAAWLPAGPGRPAAVALLLGSRAASRPLSVLLIPLR